MSGKAYNSFVYDLSKKVDRYDFIPEIKLSEKLKISSKYGAQNEAYKMS